MAHFHDSALIGASGQGGYRIERSLRFNSADSAYLNRTPASAGNRRTATWSGWIKLGNHSSTGEYYLLCTNGTSDSTFFYIQIRNNQLRFGQFNSGTFALYSTQLFRDPSAWYHIVVAVDTTQATASNRAKAYVNGTEITSWSTANYPAQNNDLGISDTRAHAIGAGYASGSPYAYWDGYVTETYLIDGQALTPSSFGETDTITGVWKPKKYAGTYGTNGFYLNFSDNSGTTSTTLGKDSSGNGNNWTPNNFSVTAGAGNDSLIDTPTPYADGGNGRGNYCTANPLNSNASTLRNGNLEFIGDTGASYAKGILGTIAVSSGKWYFEVTPDSGGTFYIGVAPSTGSGVGNVDLEYINGAYSYRGNGDKVQGTGGGGTSTAYGNTYASPDVIGIALDLDNGAIYFAKNNTWQNSGVPTSGSSKTGAAFTSFSGSYVPMACGFNGATATLNFGQRPFAYTLPSGFKALNTQNLPEPSIKKPSSYMDTLLYTGNGSARSITGLGFSPDLVWIKERSGADNHRLVDAVRGATKELYSSLTNAEGTDANGLTAFNSDGFSLGTSNSYNENGVTHVAWCWDESATPGFDIVTYTGNGASSQTINHSLGVVPAMIITKQRSATGDWFVYHQSANASPQSGGMFLSLTNAFTTNSGYWNNTAPTSTQFTVGTAGGLNASGVTAVAYLWSEVAGFSKFGSYTGNGSTDGPFVFCNFRPRWVLIKSSSVSGESWILEDSARDTYNPAAKWLYPNYSDAESNGLTIDFLSNGFKPRISGTSVNTSSATYIFAAFAESPQKYSLAR